MHSEEVAVKQAEPKPTRTLYLSLPDETYERIRLRALAEQMSVTAWIRRSLGDKPRRRYCVKSSLIKEFDYAK